MTVFVLNDRNLKRRCPLTQEGGQKRFFKGLLISRENTTFRFRNTCSSAVTITLLVPSTGNTDVSSLDMCYECYSNGCYAVHCFLTIGLGCKNGERASLLHRAIVLRILLSVYHKFSDDTRPIQKTAGIQSNFQVIY